MGRWLDRMPASELLAEPIRRQPSEPPRTAWRLNFTDRPPPLEVWTAPPMTKAATRAAYRDAVEAALLHQAVPAATACRTCRHLRRPGRADPGYCSGREDLPHAYGAGHPLRRLPADHEAACGAWDSAEETT